MEKTWVVALGSTAAARAAVRAQLVSSYPQLQGATWLQDGDRTRLLGFALSSGLRGGEVASGEESAIVERVRSARKRWARAGLGARGRVYVANSELMSRVLYYAAFRRLPGVEMALVEAEIAQYVTPGPGVFWDVSRARYEQTPAEGGMGLLPLTDLIGAAHCGLVQRLLSGEAGLWAPFAERWFRAATGVWGLGLELLMAPEFPVAEVVLPPYWLDMLQSWRGLQLTAPARRVERVSQEASDRCVFYSPLVLEGGASLRGAVWRPLAAAGVNTVGAVAAAVFGGTQLAPGLDALARRVWNALPEEWRRSGARRAHPFMTLRREMAEVTWVQQRGAGQARVLKALEATARERRFRLWDRKHPVGSRRSVALVDYTGPRCWRRVLGPGFSWSRAFRLATDRRLDRAVGHTVYRVLHGLYLRPFPERQLCPHCQQEADTAHALHCQTHARALGWLKAVADRLAGSPVTLTPDVLLGGVLAHSAFVGELGGPGRYCA